MDKVAFWKFGGLASLLFICFAMAIGMTLRAPFHDTERRSDDKCEDAVTDCKPPVRFIGEKDGCACFSCEDGKKTQHLVCTNKDADKKALFLKVPKQRP